MFATLLSGPSATARSAELLDRLNPTIAELSQAVEQEANAVWPQLQRLEHCPQRDHACLRLGRERSDGHVL